MRGSFKTRLKAKKSRQKIKRRKSAFKFAIHEVGHFVVRKSFFPDEKLEIKIFSENGRLYGRVSLPNKSIQEDPAHVRVAIAVAGVTAEKIHINRLDQVQKSFFDCAAGKGDYFIFAKAKYDLKRTRHDLSFETVQDLFNMQVDKAKNKFEEFGWDEMIKLAKLVHAKRSVIA